MKKNSALLMPHVKKYICVVEYLQNYFNYRKSLDSKFSYEIWAAELGFNSRSYLRMIIKKERKVSLRFAEVFSLKENLTSDQAQYLNLLTSYQLKNSSVSQKNVYMEKIIELQEEEPQNFEIKDYQKFLASPDLAQIFLLLTFEDIEATQSNLKKFTGFNTVKIGKSLLLLKQLGLAESKKVNRVIIWKAVSSSFKISGRNQDKSILSFHKRTLDEAKKALDENPHFRHFRSIYFPVEDKDVDLLKKEVENFLAKMKKKFGSHLIKGKRLVKLNLNAYPVSAKLIKT